MTTEEVVCSEAYDKNVENMLHGAFLGPALAIGFRLKLFDLLNDHATTEAPKTSVQLAEIGNFRER